MVLFKSLTLVGLEGKGEVHDLGRSLGEGLGPQVRMEQEGGWNPLYMWRAGIERNLNGSSVMAGGSKGRMGTPPGHREIWCWDPQKSVLDCVCVRVHVCGVYVK